MYEVSYQTNIYSDSQLLKKHKYHFFHAERIQKREKTWMTMFISSEALLPFVA